MLSPKLKAVIRHEYFTIVKQPVFWIIMLAIPTLIAAVLAITYFSSKSTDDRIAEQAKKIDNIVIIDESGLINKDIVAMSKLTLTPASEKQRVIDDVKASKIDAAILYPSDLLKSRSYEVYLSTNDLTQSSTVTSFGDTLLKSSVFAPLGSPEVIALAQNGAESKVTSYENGATTAGIMEYVVPGMFLILFYIVLVFSVNYMLTSVAEEKENRSMEMVLSYVKPRTLILGKLLGISLVTLTQIVFFATIGLLAYLVINALGNSVPLPLDIEINKLVFDPLAIFLAISYLVTGFLFFAALMAAAGSAVPSAKDAGGLSMVFIIGAILPFYTFSVIATDPENILTKIMTFFPTTAPTTLLIRNTVGNMSTLEAFLGLTALIVYTIGAMWLATRIFRLGALEFNNSLKFSSIFK